MAPIEKPTILIVDDFPENIDVLRGMLHSEYRIKAALDGMEALSIAQAAPQPDLILLDIMMPGIDGYEVCRRLKTDLRTRSIPVIFVTAMSDTADERLGFELGAVDYITKPVSLPIVRARVSTHLALYDQNRALEEKVQERTSELNRTRLEIIRRLGCAAEFKDNETGLHVIRMSHYSRLLGQAAGMPADAAELLFQAAPMHDIGKIGIPDHVLRKPSELNDEEWTIMRRHPGFGASILGDHSSELLAAARTIALTHHEKWDGTGYPDGLAGEQIPFSGRVVAIADVFDALTSERPYKPAWPTEQALTYIRHASGTHFDPTLARQFLEIVPEVLKIKEEYAEAPMGR